MASADKLRTTVSTKGQVILRGAIRQRRKDVNKVPYKSNLHNISSE
jgi:hypothetical protein